MMIKKIFKNCFEGKRLLLLPALFAFHSFLFPEQPPNASPYKEDKVHVVG